MKEEDLALARAIAAADTENIVSGDGTYSGPPRKTLVTQLQNKAKTFR